MNQSKKIIISRLGESFRNATTIVDAPPRAPAAGEVLIRNRFSGVNGVYDQMMCLNRVEHTAVAPPIDTGVEAVGLIEALGSGVEALEVGQSVATVCVGNGYRHYQLCPASEVIPIPAASPQILALIPSGVSALLALERVGELSSGEVVCITAAAGGLGNIAAQLAISASNHVICVCGDERKADWLRSIGADRVVQYRSESLRQVLQREYKDAINLAMDSVGGETFDSLVDNLAPLGRLVICGYTSDRLPTAEITQQRIYTRLYWKGASVRGFMNYRFAAFAPDARRRLLTMLEGGTLTPLIDTTVFEGLESVADAVEYLLAARNLGKVVVDLRQ